jgi:hypothetical protein
MCAISWHIQAHLSSELKTQNKFCPATLSLSMEQFKLALCSLGTLALKVILRLL